ncbi:hypothetical protein [Pedobacter sp. BS3]|nr:hypothetical protein [Pedobacter sp. BS3]
MKKLLLIIVAIFPLVIYAQAPLWLKFQLGLGQGLTLSLLLKQYLLSTIF